MKKISVEPNQTVYDLAAQHYGTLEAVEEILRNNPDLENDPAALVALGVDALQTAAFRLDVAVRPGFALRIDQTSRLIDDKVTRKIENPVTTYQTWQELSSRYRPR